MKKLTWFVLSLLLIGTMAASAGCASPETSVSTTAGTVQAAETTRTDTTTAMDTEAVTTAQDTTAAAAEKTMFTLEELQAFNGQNGNLAYVAIEGIVYDVTNNKEWKDGQHQGLSAGNDLTADLSSSPHGTTVLGDLTQVGTLLS